MSWITQCPHCKTRFRVHQAQLNARHGFVCCGRCQHAFNALTDLQQDATAPSANAASIELPLPKLTATSPTKTDSTLTDSAEYRGPASSPHESLKHPAVPSTTSSSVASTRSGVAVLATASNTLLLAGVLGLLLVLSLQLIFSFRTTMVGWMPSLRPSLAKLCQIAGCRLELSKEVGQLSLESSSLEAIEGAGGQMQLTMVIRNHANVPQTFPHLLISLTNRQDVVITRRVLAPKDYLPAGMSGRAGLPASETFEASILLSTPDVVPEGFKLLLFYPANQLPQG